MKYLVLLGILCAVLPSAEAKKWEIKGWSGNSVSKDNRFIEAFNKSTDGDILELQNDITVNADAELKITPKQTSKKVTVTSKEGNTFRIINYGESYGVKIKAGTTLVMSNVTYDCDGYPQIEDVFNLEAQNGEKVARMILEDGATICNAHMRTYYNYENAVIHIKRGAVFTMRPGSAILNCKNESTPGKGGAICCDYGTVIMTGGTIAGCTAKGAGGAIHTDGTRVDAVDNYGINQRGDIYISGGYITNNTCGADFFGGGIYLGNSGPVLHITGTAVISNNFSGTVADDVSTYNLEDAWANRLKLVDYHESHPEGFTYAGQLFTGWVGVRYPKVEQVPNPENTRFGAVWEYFGGDQEEARQFFWNGNNAYRGKIDANSLIWSGHVVHELPKDRLKVTELIASGESPIYMELSQDYKMTQMADVPENCHLVLDLKGFDLECDFHISNETARVTIMDSSSNKSGTVTGHRHSPYPNAFVLEGGSYHTEPQPSWVASNRVVIGNYCTNHPYMVAIKVWDADRERIVTDLTKVPLAESTNEVRNVEFNNGVPDIGKITFSTGDWKFMQYTNANYRVQVIAAPAVEDADGTFRESGPRAKLYDSHEQMDVAPSESETAEAEEGESEPANYGREDEFDWNADSLRGLVKLIHITMRQVGEFYETNAIETAYFRFPPAAFLATQRNPVGKLPITLVDELLTAAQQNRAYGFDENEVNLWLDGFQANGLRKWENIVTGTDENQLLLSTVSNDGNGLSLNVALTDANKQGRTDTSYKVAYDLRKYMSGTWTRVGEIMERPSFSVPLLDADGKSVNASGFYRVTTLIVPEHELSVTNEIPSTNIVGVLEVASTLTNTLTAVPWVALAEDPARADGRPVTVSNYVHTSHLQNEDSVQVADKGHIYRKWDWDKHGKKWSGAITVTKNAVLAESPAEEHPISRDSAVWVTRKDPAAKPFFLIGQYSNAPVSLEIAGGSADAPVCTLVPNPTMAAVNVNTAYKWNGKPVVGDIIRIPNENKAPLVLRWNGSEWGRYVNSGRYSVWKNDATIPAGTGAWYMRCAESFSVELPRERIEAR